MSHSLDPRRPARLHAQAFTLVELLVVISIISVLISILLPALKSARSAGQQAKCLSQVKQVFMAYEYYAQEHRDHYPCLLREVGPPSNVYWYGILFQKGYINPFSVQHRIAGGAVAGNTHAFMGLLGCPATETAVMSRQHTNLTGAAGPGSGAQSYGTSYLMPTMVYLISAGVVGDADMGRRKPLRREFVHTTSQTYLLMEGDHAKAGGNPVTTSGTGGTASPYANTNTRGNNNNNQYTEDFGFRHLGSASVLFFDGHASSMNQPTLRDSLWIGNNNSTQAFDHYHKYPQWSGRKSR